MIKQKQARSVGRGEDEETEVWPAVVDVVRALLYLPLGRWTSSQEIKQWPRPRTLGGLEAFREHIAGCDTSPESDFMSRASLAVFY